jgi:CRP/FNR family cyclic AMP-dependent transcriptional regulator
MNRVQQTPTHSDAAAERSPDQRPEGDRREGDRPEGDRAAGEAPADKRPATEPAAADVLGRIPLFAALDAAERDDLRRLLQPRRFDPQRPIFWIGEAGHDFFIIERGEVVLSYPDEGGKEVTLAVLGPGQFFGELSLFDGGRRTASARAKIETHLLCLGREPFRAFVRSHPASALHMMEVLGRRQRESLDKLRGIKNANEAVEEQMTRVQKFAEKVAAVFASEAFLILNLGFIIIWVVAHTMAWHKAHDLDPQRYPEVSLLDQPPTFFWLGFMVTLEAIVLSIFVLNSQKRQAQRDSIKADLDYQVNRKAQLEIMHLHEKIDRLQQAISQQQATTDREGPGPNDPPA